MCGRTAQTLAAVRAAAADLGVNLKEVEDSESMTANGAVSPMTKTSEQGSSSNNSVSKNISESAAAAQSLDNFNLCPGMEAIVFWKSSDDGCLHAGRKKWGIIPRGGTKSNPLQSLDDLGPHFNAMMYNARTDTLYEKPTFSRLAHSGKTCVVALEGYFEWKTEGPTGGKGNKKQPYFVHRNRLAKKQEQSVGLADNNSREHSYLLMAGLWTSVPTGYDENDGHNRPSRLDTFTILTTDSCPSIQWLHHRMPVCIWDPKLALQWLNQASQKLHRQIELASSQTPSTDEYLQWHPVTKDMVSLKFRSVKATQAIPKLKTVTSFFAPKASVKSSPANQGKKDIESPCMKVEENDRKDCIYLGTQAEQITTASKSLSANNSTQPITGPSQTLSTPSTTKRSNITAFFKKNDPLSQQSPTANKKLKTTAPFSTASTNSSNSGRKIEKKKGPLDSFFKRK